MRPEGGYTPLPNAFLDWTLPLCDGAEAKVLLYICRRIMGTEKGRAAGEAQIRINQICHGWLLADGTQADGGARVAPATAVLALSNLERKGIITRKAGSGRRAGSYQISDAALKGEIRSDLPNTPKRSGPVPETLPENSAGVSVSGPETLVTILEAASTSAAETLTLQSLKR
jgi:hypothetical protein